MAPPDAAPVLLLGADGMLGRAFAERLTREGIAFRALNYPTFDLTSEASVADALNAKTSLVINCSAWTDVDGAETREADAIAVNGVGTGRLAMACRHAGARLVHFSTDYVFDGTASEPYPTDGMREPVNAYGRSKAVGERMLEASGCRYLLIRTSWLYAPWGKNFVRTIAALARKQEVLRVVSDQRGRPTSAEGLAASTLGLIAKTESASSATFHLTDGGECSWFEFAREIVAHVAPRCQIVACPAAEYPRPARRPAYSVLDLAPAEALLGPLRSWREALADVLTRLEP
ncbi:MAG TPA: dTDP-4-dehydrorhamnose reductase [Polyangia bacterium]|jgi:dTDP-4-dehydrorhamnose reductase|nr:dTDP-4-dehydrorhamnose reductase [Polyangia bacterium]